MSMASVEEGGEDVEYNKYIYDWEAFVRGENVTLNICMMFTYVRGSLLGGLDGRARL